MAEDAAAEHSTPEFRGVSLAYNTHDRAEVDAVLAEAVAAGATLQKSAEEVFWGGYSGYFADPDGHLWEVAHNPLWTLQDDGSIILDPS
ncbi:MAG: VOC family protein [Rhodospirillaceae bacterium]